MVKNKGSIMDMFDQVVLNIPAGYPEAEGRLLPERHTKRQIGNGVVIARSSSLRDSESSFRRFVISGITSLSLSVAANYIYDALHPEVTECEIGSNVVPVDIDEITRALQQAIDEN